MSRYVKISTVSPLQLSESEFLKDTYTYESVRIYIEKLLNKVLVEKPDLIVLPEYCGRQITTPERKELYYESGSSYIFDYIKKVARDNKCYINLSHYKKMEDGTGRNCVSMIDRNGEVIGEYYKNYPTIYETEGYNILSSDEMPIFNCDFGTVCSIVCFDLNFDSVRQKVKENAPDITTFHSAFHGGLMQDFFAYDTRSYFVTSLLGSGPNRIISPVGQTIKESCNYINYITETINLDCAVCHIDYNMEKFLKAKEKYKDKLKMDIPAYVGVAMLSYEDDDKTVYDIIKEFDIELLDEYMERSINHHKKYVK